MSEKIDIAVCYHKPSIVFQSDALKPMQLGKAAAKIDLGFRGDDTGDSISIKNKYYAEDTASYWLWKNSTADIKGIMHYRRLLNLNSAGGDDKHIAMEDIKSPEQFVLDLGLDSSNISEIMKTEDIIVWKNINIRFDWQDCNIEEHYKIHHIPEHLDYSLEIIKHNFPEIYPSAKRILAQDYGHWANICIMKTNYFDALCEFKFGVLSKLEKIVDTTRPEIADGWRNTSRFLAFIGERLTIFYIEYLREHQKKIAEYPIVTIAPRYMREWWNNAFYEKDTYMLEESNKNITPIFEKDAVAVMLATNNNYAPYCGVMLQSIIENANPARNYDLVIISRDIDEKYKKLIESMARQNISIRVIYTHEYVNEALFEAFVIHGHFSIEAYFRFFIPQLFEKYEKVLYLDCDMVVLHDIADLYAEDIGDNWWGVTHDNNISVLCFDTEACEYKYFIPYLKNTLKIDSPFSYFQNGVMIWNIKQCIKDNVFDKMMDRLVKIGDPQWVDQDVMNSVANGENIFWISNYWNVPWYFPLFFSRYKERIAAYDTVIHQLGNPFIIHYAGVIKPWIEPNRPNAHYFWRYARNTPFYEMLLHSLTDAMISKHNEEKEHISLEQIKDDVFLKSLIKRAIKLILKKIISPFFPLNSIRRKFFKKIYFRLRGIGISK
jgi:lipopolysaccharide biosynthesis glycosyltransferase